MDVWVMVSASCYKTIFVSVSAWVGQVHMIPHNIIISKRSSGGKVVFNQKMEKKESVLQNQVFLWGGTDISQ